MSTKTSELVAAQYALVAKQNDQKLLTWGQNYGSVLVSFDPSIPRIFLGSDFGFISIQLGEILAEFLHRETPLFIRQNIEYIRSRIVTKTGNMIKEAKEGKSELEGLPDWVIAFVKKVQRARAGFSYFSWRGLSAKAETLTIPTLSGVFAFREIKAALTQRMAAFRVLHGVDEGYRQMVNGEFGKISHALDMIIQNLEIRAQIPLDYFNGDGK